MARFSVPMPTRFENEARPEGGACAFRLDTGLEEEARPKFRLAWPRSKLKTSDFGAPAYCNVPYTYFSKSKLIIVDGVKLYKFRYSECV
jgi:hypothetical protein